MDEEPPDFDLDKLARNEAAVRGGFWRKVQRTLGSVPFLDEALAAYYCAIEATRRPM